MNYTDDRGEEEVEYARSSAADGSRRLKLIILVEAGDNLWILWKFVHCNFRKIKGKTVFFLKSRINQLIN